MKKVLFATTALVASAGIAAAGDITFSGSAEMGVVGGGNANVGLATAGVTQFNNDLTLSVGMSGDTDSGLTFGVKFDFSKANPNANGNVSIDNEAAYVSGAFGTLTLGEIDGAMDYRLTENIGNPGTIGDDETIHAGYMGWYGDGAYDNQILRYDYSFGDFGFSVSTEIDDTDTVDAGYAVAISYNTSFSGVDMGFGLGYQTLEVLDKGAVGDADNFIPGNLGAYAPAGLPAGTDIDIVGVTVTADFNNGFVAGLEYSEWDMSGAVADANHVALSMGYTINAWSFGANWGKYDIDGPNNNVEGYGLVAAYDLGGGASIHAGYGDSDIQGVNANFETWSLGVAMSF
ncbi:MAG: porin [Rhodobacteraceae bacterium]|nr:porin [Paracoccaceae bacterium]